MFKTTNIYVSTQSVNFFLLSSESNTNTNTKLETLSLYLF